MLTSGKVPLEKTLFREHGLVSSKDCDSSESAIGGCLHQKTSLSTSTVTHDYEFAANLSHLDCTRSTSQRSSVLRNKRRFEDRRIGESECGSDVQRWLSCRAGRRLRSEDVG